MCMTYHISLVEKGLLLYLIAIPISISSVCMCVCVYPMPPFRGPERGPIPDARTFSVAGSRLKGLRIILLDSIV